MASLSFDDPALLAAMSAFVTASAAIASATTDSDLVNLSEAKAIAGLSLRKRLLDLGWTAPQAQRTST